MKEKKLIQKQIKQYELKIKSGMLSEEEADKMMLELERMILRLEQLINISVNKLKNKI